jgi:beta-galactosidase
MSDEKQEKEQPDWENPSIRQINTRKPRSTSWPSKSEVPITNDYLYNIDDYRLSLNGEWDFNWSPDPDSRPKGFEKKSYHTNQWGKIPVPGNFELNGYGTPIYSNQRYIFKCNPPYVTSQPPENWWTFNKRNPVGCYKKAFCIPAEWEDRETLIHFAGVASAFYVWVNGHKVGYSQDSMSPAEYNITPYLNEGENDLAVEVYSFCDGTYLEDQDFWRFSGIFRDVFLYSVNKVHLEDINIQGILLERNEGLIEANIEIFNEDDLELNKIPENLSIEINLYDTHANSLLHSEKIKVKNACENIKFRCEKMTAWNPEQPFLYSVVVKLIHKEQYLDIRHFRKGFAFVEIKDRKLLVNGQSIKLKGINRHEHNSKTGRVMNIVEMEKDVKLMKEAHMNSVRTSHYPDHPLWYEICDQQGLIVMDEANVESHEISYHRRVLPGDDKNWTDSIVERADAMVKRDRCHTSILLWSLGNEAGYGTAFEAMAQHIRKLDSRPIHYADMNLPADFDSQTYPTPQWLDKYVDGTAKRKGEQGQDSNAAQHGEGPSNKPFVMNEYTHVMGNSGGNFHLYWDRIYQHDCLVGGYIWEWCDHGLYQEKDGKQWYAYGGDFGDIPNDGNFCCDGLVGPDRTPNPHYYEIQYIQRPIALLFDNESKKLYLENRHFFTNLKKFEFKIEIKQNNKCIDSLILNFLECKPGSAIIIKENLSNNQNGETHCNLTVVDKESDCLYLQDQLVINKNNHMDNSNHYTGTPLTNVLYNKINRSQSTLKFNKTHDKVIIEANENIYEFSLNKGCLDFYSKQNNIIFNEPLAYNFWRVPTDNDIGNKLEQRSSIWKDIVANLKLEPIEIINEDTELYEIKVNHLHLESGVNILSTYSFKNDGSLLINTYLNAPATLPNIPRLGFVIKLNESPESVDWNGRGPHECYSDRKLSAHINQYNMKANQLATNYIRPQENGQRCDINMLNLNNDGNQSILQCTSEQLFSFTLHPYSQYELEQANHTFDLPEDANWHLYLDHMQMGVGGDNSWGANVHPSYCIPSGDYQWMFKIE